MSKFNFYHCALILEFLVVLIVVEILAGGIRLRDNPAQHLDPFETYGTLPTVLLYSFRFMVFLTIPFALFNILGILLFNAFPDKPKLKVSPMLAPFICLRVVTRGEFPEMVRENVERNIETCQKLGIDKFMVEVVTEKSINLDHSLLNRTREVVVPKQYKPKNGALYKARALNYCLENGVNTLNDEDWLVHLDEETLVTENSMIGILNFIHEGQYMFGQGYITYASEGIVNWCTTLADCVRVAVDFGMLRFAFTVWHKPVFGWKGSYVVVNVAAERRISYDHGAEGSVAEDCFFAMRAYGEGYSFGWIEGDMLEKSTFTFLDFLRQRRRWLQGLYLAFHSKRIATRCKIGLFFMVYSGFTVPLNATNAFLPIILPVPTWQIFDILCGFQGAVVFFMFLFGAQKSFNYVRLGRFKYICCVLSTLLNLPVVTVCESSAAIWAMCTTKKGFHVVSKDPNVGRKKKLGAALLV